ncbi:MAG: CBS domain-containing protein [Burkholderiaceae bacterium]|jgi:acetoin utilization protein AcuB|nr:CBS domain-containing protein [Burkholderiaceae bacterium]
MSARKPVEEFTTPNPVTATANTSIDELRAMMTTYGVRHLPIVRDGDVVGLVSDRDLRVAQGLSAAHQLQVLAADIMSTDPVSVKAETPLDEVALTMSDRKIGSVLVHEADGTFLGIFTLTDALNALIEVVRARAG